VNIINPSKLLSYLLESFSFTSDVLFTYIQKKTTTKKKKKKVRIRQVDFIIDFSFALSLINANT